MKSPFITFGTDDATKSDEFSEKFQTAFDPPPPSCLENYVAFFFDKRSKKPI